MAYALLSVGENYERKSEGSYLPLWRDNEKRPEGIEMLTTCLFLLRLPETLKHLGTMTEELDRYRISYALAFFAEKPDFHLEHF